MRRTVWAIILGILLPAIWLILAGTFTHLIGFFPLLTDIRINGEIFPGLLFVPVLVPVYIDIILRRNGILPSMFDSVGFRVASLVLFNWVFYGMVIYLLLGKLKRFKKQTAETEPPSPPVFDQS